MCTPICMQRYINRQQVFIFDIYTHICVHMKWVVLSRMITNWLSLCYLYISSYILDMYTYVHVYIYVYTCNESSCHEWLPILLSLCYLSISSYILDTYTYVHVYIYVYTWNESSCHVLSLIGFLSVICLYLAICKIRTHMYMSRCKCLHRHVYRYHICMYDTHTHTRRHVHVCKTHT